MKRHLITALSTAAVAISLAAAPSADAVTKPAQKQVKATVSLGLPAYVMPSYVPFTVPTTVDDAKSITKATAPASDDVDLFLQKLVGGTWTDVKVTGGQTSGQPTETMTSGRLTAGKYRVEVDNFLGIPNDQVKVVVTFYNSAGQVGR